jgi:hypothetical protein
MTECDVKGQGIRLVDVFVLGPFMIWVGVKAEGIPTWAKYTMVASGVATIAFNGANYLRLGPGHHPGAGE